GHRRARAETRRTARLPRRLNGLRPGKAPARDRLAPGTRDAYNLPARRDSLGERQAASAAGAAPRNHRIHVRVPARRHRSAPTAGNFRSPRPRRDESPLPCLADSAHHRPHRGARHAPHIPRSPSSLGHPVRGRGHPPAAPACARAHGRHPRLARAPAALAPGVRRRLGRALRPLVPSSSLPGRTPGVPMRKLLYEITHTTAYTYSSRVLLSHHLLHLTPREGERQERVSHELITEPAAAVAASHEDAFGNVTGFLSIEIPHDRLVITSRSRVKV